MCPGIAALVVALCGILLALNFAPSMGWTNPGVLAGFAVGIVALFALIKIEGKAAEPLIPLRLFKITTIPFCSSLASSATSISAP